MPAKRTTAQQIESAVQILGNGGIVVFPTDTVYGLGASPLIETAVERIYAVKRRPPTLPLPLLLADKSDVSRVAREVPDVAWRLVERFLPGGLTLVLRKSAWVPDSLTGGGDTIAVRVPNHEVPIALARGLGTPIVGTSANISGRPSPRTAAEVRAQLGEQVDLVIGGGSRPGGTESTVIDLSGGLPVLVREGAVPEAEIAEICHPLLRKTKR